MSRIRFRDQSGYVRVGTVDDDQIVAAGRTYDVDAVDVLPPTEPSKIVCVGRNYAKHADELGNEVPDRPLLFLKPPNAVATPGSTVTLPAGKDRVDHEAEIAFVIGEQARNVATLPGIRKHAVVLPDGHQGYGFPIGAVAAVDPDEGVVSPGGIGFDVNCGVRVLRTDLSAEDVTDAADDLADATEDGRVIGEVAAGDSVEVRGLSLS